MKINTDGVLLGALVNSQHPSRILDIGTGTGVIAMMLAQRFPFSQVDAVEIDEDAYATAIQNFQNSAFSNRLRGYSGSFEDLKKVDNYDLLVSNPPFYTNSLHNPDLRKKLARHTDFHFFDKLLLFAKENLSDRGELNLILPIELADYVIREGLKQDFHLVKKIEIKSFVNTDVIRNIITLSKVQNEVEIVEFVIYESKGVHSQEYKELLKPFFLAF
ncbi:tRNA1(Val) (adenine(37)-N6)-methyltransferase [Sphingobacterium alimentarium]|nr:methyltransferase [Sphingobacterium alimentarium]